MGKNGSVARPGEVAAPRYQARSVPQQPQPATHCPLEVAAAGEVVPGGQAMQADWLPMSW